MPFGVASSRASSLRMTGRSASMSSGRSAAFISASDSTANAASASAEATVT